MNNGKNRSTHTLCRYISHTGTPYYTPKTNVSTEMEKNEEHFFRSLVHTRYGFVFHIFRAGTIINTPGTPGIVPVLCATLSGYEMTVSPSGYY